jgi:hypothetical protein
MAVAMPVFSGETVRQISRDIKFAAADVNFTFAGFTKRDRARIQPVNQRPE